MTRLFLGASVLLAVMAGWGCSDGGGTTSTTSGTTSASSGGDGGAGGTSTASTSDATTTTTTSSGGGAGGEGGGGEGGGGGAGGAPPATPGASGVETVSAGEVCTSPSYRMVFTLGQPSQNQGKTTSPSYRIQGGLIGATGSLP